MNNISNCTNSRLKGIMKTINIALYENNTITVSDTVFKDVSSIVQALWEQENIGTEETLVDEVLIDETHIQQLESKVDMDEASDTLHLESNVDNLGSIDDIPSRCSSKELNQVL